MPKQSLPAIVDLPCELLCVQAVWSKARQYTADKRGFFSSAVAIFCFFAIVIGALNNTAVGQSALDVVNTTGIQAFGSYQAGDIDTIDLSSGRPMVNIPLISYPQRGGKLKLGFVLQYHNVGTILGNTSGCLPTVSGPCVVFPYDSGFTPVLTGLPAANAGCNTPPNSTGFIGCEGFVHTWDGAVHQLMPLGATSFRAMDSSGFRIDVSSGFPASQSLTTILTDGDGTRYIATESPTTNSFVAEDVNGNQITSDPVNGLVDTMGRHVPGFSPFQVPWPSPPVAGVGGATTDFSGCSGPLPIVAASVWNPPGPNGGTYALKFCFVLVSETMPPAQFQTQMLNTTATQLQSVVLPDLSTWTFQYATDGSGTLSQITFPTGGTLTYEWINPINPQGTVGLQGSGIAAPWAIPFALKTRTLDPGGDGVLETTRYSYSWNFPNCNPCTNTVTDGEGNDTVHTFAFVGSANTGFRLLETTTQSYQGSSSTGALLRTSVREYKVTTAAGGASDPIAGQSYVPTRDTITLANGLKTKTEYDYDLGFPIQFGSYDASGNFLPSSCSGQCGPGLYGLLQKVREYGYGTGDPSTLPLLRTTTTDHRALSDQSFLDKNLLNLLASKVVVAGNATASSIAYGYDEFGLGSSGISTHIDLNPAPGTHRGNLTSISRFLNTSTPVVTQLKWYDSGMLFKEIDPLGNETTHSYDSAFAGAYPTETCNALNQCVSATYDFNTGAITSFTDANAAEQGSGTSPGDVNHTTLYNYDLVGRLTTAISPPDPFNGVSATSKFEYSPPNTFPASVKRTKSVTTTSDDILTTYVDGLGRPHQTQHETPECTVVVDTNYDSSGRIGSVSNPYCLGTKDAGVPTYGVTSTTYDGLGRVTDITRQDGGLVSTNYDQLAAVKPDATCSVTKDEADNPRRVCTDALGRVVEVDEPTGGSAASSGSGSASIAGSEQSAQLLATPASSGIGNVQIGGTIQWKTVSSATTAGTTNITITGAEQQNPVGVIPGSGSISFSGSEQNIPAVAATATVSITGAIQSTQVQSQAATIASGSVTIAGAEQSETVLGDKYCADYSFSDPPRCVDWEFNSSQVSDSGSVSITVNGHTDSIGFGANSSPASIASGLVSTINADTAAPVTATLSGTTVVLTSKSTGTAANLPLTSSYTWDSADFGGSSFTTSNSGAALTGGQNAVTNTVYDSGSCTITVGGHSNSDSWSGSATTAAGIASALSAVINGDTLAPVSASVSGTTISLAAKATGSVSNYPLNASCSHDTAHFASGSFASSSSGAALTGGQDQINDAGSFTVTVNGHASPSSNWGFGSTPSSIASDLAGKINGDTAAAVTASASGPTVTLTAKIKGSISNYSFSAAPLYDSSHFSHASFANSNSGATLTGGWPNPSAVDSGTMTITVNTKPYTINWGSTDTPGSIAASLATTLAADTTITSTLSGTTVYLNPKQSGTSYSFSTSRTYDTADFTQSSFGTGNSISDWGAFTVTVGGHGDSVAWAGLSTPSSIATALANQINNDSLAVVQASASVSTVSLTAKTTGTASNYNLVSSTTFDSTHFTTAAFSGTNSGAALTGGANAVFNTVYDSGSLFLSVGSGSYIVDYGQGDTVATLAAKLAAKINAGTVAHATVSGGVLNLTANDTGEDTNYFVSGTTTLGNFALFPTASFTFPFNTEHLAGGADQAPGTLATPLVTLYSYDALDNLLCVEQHGDAATGTGCAGSPSLDATSPWRVRRFSYDSLSRLVSSSNPESNTGMDANGNPVRVPTTYSYDLAGNLLQKTSPAPNQTGTATQTISYCYDPLNRMIGKAYSAQSCPLASPVMIYSYDAGANGIGHLTGLADQAGSGLYSYDSLGRLSDETRTIAGISKSMSYDYDLGGSLKALHYPSGATATYTPDSAGRVSQVEDNGNSINYISGVTYEPDGQMAGFVSGGAITSSFTYDKRLQPVTMSASTANQAVLSIGYDFHLFNKDNGNVWTIANLRDNQRDQTFTYDSLNRLVSARNAGTDCNVGTLNSKTAYWGNSYAYDAWGNLIGKNITKCGAENLPLTALASNQLSGYGYDAAGNMTSDPTDNMSASYDPENRIARASTIQGVFTYSYDADGNRVEKSGNGSGTLYWYMTPGVVAESDLTGNLKSEYIFLNGERVARRDFGITGGVFYYFSDHLKTAAVITDSAGNIKSDSDYYPWGGELQFTNSDSNHYKFTGKERDSESGLDYFGARYNSPGMGRFMTPDPLGGMLVDPQSLNRYSYVRNNPLRYIDPTGMYLCSDSEKCDSKDDKAFEKARKNDLKSNDPNVVRGAKALGDPGKDNGTTLKFANTNNGKNGKTVTGSLRPDPDHPGHWQALVTVIIKPGLSGTSLDGAVAHEGTHVADAQDFAATVSSDLTKYDYSKNLTQYQTEVNAYRVTQAVQAAANEKSAYGDGCTGGPCIFGPGVRNIDEVINQLLASPSNNYNLTPDRPGARQFPDVPAPATKPADK